MIGILVDSDVLIELLRGRNAAVAARVEALLGENVPIFYSGVSSAEIGQGARESETEAISALFSFLTCLSADCEVAAEAGAILRRFRKSHSIGLGDALIAATALKHGLLLWTRNRKHYPDARLQFFEHS
jgi:predicted nucleic acid-binding protein